MLQSDDETFFFIWYFIEILGEGQLLEQLNVKRMIVRNFKIRRILKEKNERWVTRFFYFQIYFLFLYLFKLFWHSKYKIIYEFWNLWNFNSFCNCKILEIFRIFHVRNFCSFLRWIFLEFSEFNIFRIFEIANFWNSPNWNFLVFSKLTFFRISKIANS